VIDELDKMSSDDTSALHEGMEQQQITFSKANIHATLLTRASVLAAANPKLGRFDPYQSIAAQINLPPALINRFDLIFPIKDIPDVEIDTKIANHVLEMHSNKGNIEPEIDIKLMKKYISYVKKKIFPQLTEGAKDEIRNFYVSLRNTGGSKDEVKPIPISARQLEALIRLSEASARLRLSQKITKEDSRRAIRILKKCLNQVGLDPETGKIDIDRIATGISTAQRSKIITVRELINDFDKNGVKTIPINDLIKMCVEKGLEEAKAEEILEKMTREGEVFQPKVGFISKI
jgi:replicative DNA helicase Mcm